MAEFNQMDEWIIDDLVESIQENHTIWRETFERDENANSLPRSGVTGQVFNSNLEGFVRLQRQYDFTDPRWMTRADFAKLGWELPRDARGVVVGKDDYDKDIVVFNVEQAKAKDGYEANIKPWNPEIKEKQWFNIARADFILNASGANIKHGFRSSQYNTVSDNICLPYQSNFKSADDYYWTAFHELMHWTGNNSRLARNTSGDKRSPLYAREELVAELGAYMMCLRTGVSFDKSNASAYIKGWAENMQLDSASLKKELTLAWSEARRACDFVSRNVLMNMKKNNMKLDNSGRVYLNVEKDDVKEAIALGARYDTRQYAFYITPEDNISKFNKFLSEEHRVSDVSVSLITENEYEREEDRAEEIRRGLEAEANAPPVEDEVNLTSNLARYIAYSAIKGEHQLNSFYGDDLSSIISEIHDTSHYIDSSHFAHDVTDTVKNQIVASIAKNSNYSESEVYEQWDKDVNAYIRNARSIFVQMDKALFSLKYNLKNSFEDDVNHIRMLDEAYHDDAFLALINPKVENTVTEEAEQVAEVSENSEFVQKNENEAEQSNTEISEEQPELSITDFIKKYEAQFNKVIDLVENNIAYQNAVRNSDRANADMEFSKAFKESETQVLIENTHQYADLHNDLFDNDRYAEVEDYLFKQSYQKLIDRNQAKHLNNDEKTTIARYIAYKEVRNTSFGHELIQDGSLGKVLSDVEWKENDNLSVLAAKVAISTKKHAIEGMSRAWNMTLEDTQSAVSKVSSGGFDSHKLAIERMNEGVKQIITNITHSYGMADFDQLLNEARSDVRFNEQLSANLEPVQNKNAEFVQKNENAETKQKTLLSVPFEEKDLAKELGAKFDRETKSWYVPEGMDLEPFERWKPTLQHEKIWIKAPFEMHEQIKELGAKYDANAKCWFVPENVDLKPFENLKQDLELNKVQSERTDTPIAFFVEKMREAGLVIDKYPEINGRSTRVAVQGDKAGQKSGWYKIHTDGVPVCLFQNWRTGDGVQKLVAPSTKIDMSIDLEKVKVNTEAMAAKLSSQEEATKQLHAEVAKNVQERLAVYKESERTEYIQRKDIPVYKGIYATNRGATVVPLADIDGNVKTMQTILPAGTKMFEKGGELKGSMHVINADNLAEAKGGIVICEGYATGATIREATNGHFGVVCAMTSHNLLDVAKAVSEKYPDKPLIIAGDNDRFNVNGNVGRLTAEAVAKELGAKVVIPEFKDNDRGSDFNDLKKSEGLDKVKEVFRQLLQKKQEAKQEEKVEKKKSRGR